MQIPSILTAGDSATWSEPALSDRAGQPVDSGSYALSYSLRGPTAGAGLDVTGTASAPGWLFALTSEQTAALNTGTAPVVWYWQAYASKTGVRLSVGNGMLRVRPNLAGLATAGTFDGRSKAEQVLDAIETEINARVTGGASIEYTIGTRTLKKEPMSALLDLRARYRAIVARERAGQASANKLGRSGVLGVRF